MEVRNSTYTLNELGQRTSAEIFDRQGVLQQATQFVYDEAGRLFEEIFNSGHKRRLIYSFSGAVDKIEYVNDSGQVVSTDKFDYNNALQRTAAFQYSRDVDTGTINHTMQLDYTLRGQSLQRNFTKQ